VATEGAFDVPVDVRPPVAEQVVDEADTED
jgi:hypothetical protein